MIPELFLALHSAFFTLILQCVFAPVGVNFVPHLRRYSWFRALDRRLGAWGLTGGMTSTILFSQMFFGIFGTECGPHLALFSWLHFRFIYAGRLDGPIANFFQIYVFYLTILFIVLYFFCGLASAFELSKQMRNSMSKRGQSWSLKSVLNELMMLSLSMLSVGLRKYFPGVKIIRGILYDEDLKLKMDIYQPKNLTGLAPVLLYLHGGSWVSGNRSNVSLKDSF